MEGDSQRQVENPQKDGFDLMPINAILRRLHGFYQDYNRLQQFECTSASAALELVRVSIGQSVEVIS